MHQAYDTHALKLRERHVIRHEDKCHARGQRWRAERNFWISGFDNAFFDRSVLTSVIRCCQAAIYRP